MVFFYVYTNLYLLPSLLFAYIINYIYFSKTTTDGGTTYTYSYISVANKTTVPAGVIKLAKSTVTAKTPVAGTTTAETGKFYFDKYYSNNGQYAVKIIKIEA